jgi:hypothetical protein
VRSLVLFASFALLALFAFLTISVAIRDGVSVVVVLSGVILLVLGLGVLGAMGSAGDE